MAREPSWSINYQVSPRCFRVTRKPLCRGKEGCWRSEGGNAEERRKGGKDAAPDKSCHATQKQSAMVLARVCRVMHWYRQVIYAYGACRSIRTSRAHACAKPCKRYTCARLWRVHYALRQIIKQTRGKKRFETNFHIWNISVLQNGT